MSAAAAARFCRDSRRLAQVEPAGKGRAHAIGRPRRRPGLDCDCEAMPAAQVPATPCHSRGIPRSVSHEHVAGNVHRSISNQAN